MDTFRFLLVAFLGTVICSGIVVGQAPPPPPAPLIYSAPEAKILKKFEDTENKFVVEFPGTPSKSVWVGENVRTVTYKVNRSGSNSSVSILAFPVDVESKRGELLNSYKEKLPELTEQGPKTFSPKLSNVVFDREINISGRKGREFGFESDFHFTHVVVFVSADRLFEIKLDVTNWHILKKHHPEIVKAFQTEAERFLKSFSLIK